jgi:hypothetical protein
LYQFFDLPWPGEVAKSRFDEAEPLGEDAGERGAGFLGAVFVVAGEEDDVLAMAEAGVALILNSEMITTKMRVARFSTL